MKQLAFSLYTIVTALIYCSPWHARVIAQSNTPTRVAHAQELVFQTKLIEAKQKALIGHHDRALDAYLKLYETDKNNSALCYEIARTYQELHNHELTVKFYKKAIELDGSNPWHFHYFAEYLSEKQDYNQAAIQFKKLTELVPQNKQYYLALSSSYLADGQPVQSIEALNMAEQHFGIDEEFTRRKFELYSDTKQNEMALAELKKIALNYPSEPGYHINIAKYFIQLDDHKSAKSWVEKTIKIDPNNHEAQLLLSQLSTNKNDVNAYANGKETHLYRLIKDESVEIDQKIKALIPKILDDKLYQEESELQNIASMIENLIKIHGDDPKSLALAGDFEFNRQNWSKASEYYERVVSMNPSVYTVWSNWMYAIDALGNNDKLKSIATNALDYYPTQSEVYYFLGKSLMSDSPEEAYDYFFEAQFMVGDDQLLRYKIYTYLAQIAWQKKDSKGAKRFFDLAREISQESNPILDTLEPQLK